MRKGAAITNCLKRAGATIAEHRHEGVLPWLLLLVGVVLLDGCAVRVRQSVNLQEPVTVCLVDQGRHSSLVLPREEGVVRYTYGEWDWYAKDRRGVLAGMSAMLWPTRGALGRKVYPGVEISPFPSRVVPEGLEEVYTLQAEAHLVRLLQRELDTTFEAGREHLIYHPVYDLEFVPYPQDYWFGHQSNQVTAEWLRRLGLTVDGGGWFSDWRIEAPSNGHGEGKTQSPAR